MVVARSRTKMGPELRLETEDKSGEGKRVLEGRRRVIGERKKSQR